MGRTLRVLDSPDQIIPDRPVKPVRGRAARLAAIRAEREARAPQKPVQPQPEDVPAEPGPIVWAKKQWHEIIPYCLDQPR